LASHYFLDDEVAEEIDEDEPAIYRSDDEDKKSVFFLAFCILDG